MIAAYDAQFASAAPAPAAAPADPPKTPEVPPDPNASSPKLTDPPVGEEPPKDPSDPKDPQATPSLGDLFKDGTFAKGFTAEQIPDNLSAALKAAGLDDAAISEIHTTFRAGQAAVQREAVGRLHEAAGGKAAFDSLIQWGQKNLSAEQREYFDGQLNGPMAAEAIAVLRQRMQSGSDPKIAVGTTSAGPVVSGFRSQQEVTAAMADPRYWNDPAYHNEVKAKLKVSTF